MKCVVTVAAVALHILQKRCRTGNSRLVAYNSSKLVRDPAGAGIIVTGTFLIAMELNPGIHFESVPTKV